MNKTQERIFEVREQLESLERHFLTEKGWQYVCVFCVWLWTKEFPADEVLRRPATTFLCSQVTAMAVQNIDDSLHCEDSE